MNTMPVDELTRTFSALADPTRRAILTRLAEGEAMCREAVGLIEVTGDLSTHAGARVDLAEALWTAGREAESRAELLRAVALYDSKGNAVAGRRARALIGR